MLAEREPASEEAMELNFLQLEHGPARAARSPREASGGDQPPVDLQRRRAELADRIARRSPSAREARAQPA